MLVYFKEVEISFKCSEKIELNYNKYNLNINKYYENVFTSV